MKKFFIFTSFLFLGLSLSGCTTDNLNQTDNLEQTIKLQQEQLDLIKAQLEELQKNDSNSLAIELDNIVKDTNALETLVKDLESKISGSSYDDTELRDSITLLQSSLAEIKNNGSVYDDTELRDIIAQMQISIGNIVDNDTIYDDTELQDMLTLVQASIGNLVDNDTDLRELITKIQLDISNQVDNDTIYDDQWIKDFYDDYNSNTITKPNQTTYTYFDDHFINTVVTDFSDSGEIIKQVQDQRYINSTSEYHITEIWEFNEFGYIYTRDYLTMSGTFVHQVREHKTTIDGDNEVKEYYYNSYDEEGRVNSYSYSKDVTNLITGETSSYSRSYTKDDIRSYSILSTNVDIVGSKVIYHRTSTVDIEYNYVLGTTPQSSSEIMLNSDAVEFYSMDIKIGDVVDYNGSHKIVVGFYN